MAGIQPDLFNVIDFRIYRIDRLENEWDTHGIHVGWPTERFGR